MTEQEKQRRLAEIDAELARRSGDKKALAEATNRLFQLQVPKQSTAPSLSPTVTEPASARLARTGQAAAETLGAARPKTSPRNAPDTGATSLVTNKVKAAPAPARTQPTAKAQGTPARRLTYDQAQKALTASGGGTPAKGLEAVDKAFKDVQKAKESQSPRALDKQFAAELALKQALGENTMQGRTAEQLRQGEVLRQGRGTPYVAPDTAQQDLEAAVITTLLGIAPGVGGQLAIGAAGKLIPQATQAARPMLSNLLKGGAAIGGAAGTAKAQDIALENVLGQDQYTKMQQDLAAFQGRQPLLTSMLQGGAGAIMQRPSLAASLGERLVGAGMGAGLSVGGDIMAGQPTDLSKAGIEALVNAALAGPNTKSGDVLESLGAKAVAPLVPKVSKAPKAFNGILKPPTAPQGVSFVDPNAPTPAPVTKIGTTAQAPTKPKVTLPTGEAGKVSPESLITTAPTQRKSKAPVTAPEPAPVSTQETYPIRSDLQMKPMRDESPEDFSKRQQVASSWADYYEQEIARIKKLPARANAEEWTNVSLRDARSDSTKAGTLRLLAKRLSQLKSDPDYDSTSYTDFAPSAKTTESAPVPAQPVKETAETFTRPAEPVKETPKSEQVVGEVTPTVVKEPLADSERNRLARQVESSLANLNSPDKATSEAARASLDESLATLRDNAIIKGEGVKTTGKIVDKDTFAQSVKEAFGITDEQAGELSDLVDDWANGWAKKEKDSGRLPDATAADFYATIGGIHRFDDDLAQLVLGKKAATSKGARLPESKVIVALQKGDTTTAVHEMAHHFLDTLPEAARKKVMDSLPGTTASNVHEQFATGFEAGLKDSNSPLHRYYKKFKMWIDETYKGLVNKWKSLAGYEEGALKVTSTEKGKNVVSFTTGLKGDALDVVMDYINTGRMAKGSAVEGVPALKVEAVDRQSLVDAVKAAESNVSMLIRAQERLDRNGMLATDADRKSINRRKPGIANKIAQTDGIEKQIRDAIKERDEAQKALNDFDSRQSGINQVAEFNRIMDQLNNSPESVAIRKEEEAQRAQTKNESEALLSVLSKEKSKAESELSDWQGRTYKDNKTTVTFEGDGPTRNESMSIGTINRNRKSQQITALKESIDRLSAIESTLSDPDKSKILIDQIKEAWVDAGKRVNEGALGSQESLFEYTVNRDLLKVASVKGTVSSTEASRVLLNFVRNGPHAPKIDVVSPKSEHVQVSKEPQFQTDDSANESTILGIPLKNSALQGFFDVDPDTLKDNSTTIEAERNKALGLANSPGFAEKVVADILDGKKVISPALTAENMVAAAEAAKRRMAWETAKASDAPQAEVDKAFADYMKFVQATKDIGTEVGLALRMRQEAIGGDPIDPDSYISRAASTFTRDLNDPRFKEFVDKITAKSAVARQSYDNLQAEIARLNAQVDELLKGTPADTEVKKAEAEQQVFGTTTVPKRKKVAEGTTGAKEGQNSTGGATTPRVSGTTAKVKSNANRDRAFAKLKSDKISDSVSSIAKEALSIAQGLASKYGGKKVQFQTDDDIDVDTQDISEFRRDIIGVGRGLLAAGTRNFKTWKEEIGGILDDAGIDPLEEHQYQVLWVDSKLSLRDEVGDVQSIKSSTAGTTIQQVIGSLGLDGAGRWLDGISDQDGNPTIFEKMVKGEDLTPAELDGAARVWMEVQRANGLKVSKRGKEGALADIRRVASEIRARDRKAAKQSEYVPLTSEQGADIVRKALARVRTAAQEKRAADPIRLAASEVLASIRNLQSKAVGHQSPEAVQKTVDDALTLLEQGKVAESKALLKDSTAEVVRLRKEARIAAIRAKNEVAKGPFTQAQAEERISKAIAGLGEASKAKPSTDPLKKSAGDLVAAINRTKTALTGKAPLSEVTQAAEEALARYKSGDLEGAKQTLADLREKYPSTPTDVTMDKALASISAMTKKLGKLTGDSEVNVDPSLRARLSRFNALAVALAKKSIGTEKGQLSTTEFTALVDSAAQAFRDAGSDVEKHQQVLRDLRSSVLKARGLDPNARYQYEQFKSNQQLRDHIDKQFAQDGQALVDLVKNYASGRKQSIPNPLLHVATVEYAKAGNSLTAWAKAVENRWGSKLDRDQLDALYAQAGMKFASMKDPATGVPYAVQIRRIKEQMEYEVQKLTYDQLSPADKAIRSLGEIGMAITGNVASFDYSFAGRQAGAALILAPDLYAKSLLEGVKATGIGKVSPEKQSLLFDNASSAFFNDRFGSADYYKKVGLEITDDAFSDIYTHHGLITPNGRMVSEALSTVGVRPALDIAAKAAEKRGDTAKAQALRARAENMRGPGQRSEAMNRMFVKQLRFDLFRRLTKDGMVYKRLTDQLESATTDAEKMAIQQKITYQEEYNKMVAKMISITTGKAAVERASVRNMLTTLGRVGVWSPSFWLSRVQAMTAYPAWDVVFGQNDLKFTDKLKLAAYPIALQQAEIQAFNLALFLLSRIPGVQIMGTDDDEAGGRKTPWNWLGTDPLNTDFGKVKYDGQEYDLSAGMRKHIVFAQRSYELAAQGYEDWNREQLGRLPKDNEYDPYYDSKVTVEDGKRQLLQYIKSSMNPVAGTIYDITRGGAEDALGRKMSPLETSLRMIVPIPLANVAYSTLVDRPEEARRAAQTQDPSLMQRVQDNNNTFVRDTILTSFADMVGVSSAVRDRELEDGIKQASKHSGWMSKGYIPSKKDDELRNEVTKLLKDSIALSGTGDTYPSKKEVDLQAREVLKMLPLARMDRESLLSVKKQFAEQVAKGKKVHKYMKTTPFSINGNLPK